MISVQGRGRPRRERPSVALSIVPSVAFPDSSPSFELEISKQPDGPLGPKSPANTSVPKYSKDNLQRIFKAVLEAWVSAPAPALASAPVVSEMPREKLKARFLDVYCEKSHMDCYNFCQQYEDYFAIAGATRLTQISFTASFLWDRISFR